MRLHCILLSHLSYLVTYKICFQFISRTGWKITRIYMKCHSLELWHGHSILICRNHSHLASPFLIHSSSFQGKMSIYKSTNKLNKQRFGRLLLKYVLFQRLEVNKTSSWSFSLLLLTIFLMNTLLTNHLINKYQHPVIAFVI